MPRTVLEGLQEGVQSLQQGQNQGIDSALKRAQLLAQIQNQPLDMQVKNAELAKLGTETSKADMELENMKKWGNPTPAPLGGGTPSLGLTAPSLGQTAPSVAPVDTQNQYIVVPDPATGTYKQVPNKNFMSSMDQKKAAYIDAKLAETAQKNKEESDRKEQNAEDLKTSASDAIGTIEKVKAGSKYFGPLGELPSAAAPSSLVGEYGKRADWESNINKLLSGRVIDIMTKMKQASKTGATGFGQLSEKELQVLQNASTALNKKLDPKTALGYLNDLEGTYQKVVGGNSGVPEFASEADVPPTFKGRAKVGGVVGTIQ